MNRQLRIATIFVLPLLAGVIVRRANDAWMDVTAVLVFAWTVMSAALLVRLHEARKLARTYSARPDTWQHLDILTATGRSMMWGGFFAGIGAAWTGWASLSIVCIFGIGATCIAATWTAVAAGGVLPWRRATMDRAILPAKATEGDQLREEIKITGITIPAGMRLFVQSLTVRHGMTARYVVGTEGSNAEIQLTSDLGPAPRGEHQVPPAALWLGDVLGLTRTPYIYMGETALMVVPKPAQVDGVKRLKGTGGEENAQSTTKLPTEGTMRIKDYAPGDDARRIHWVRSLVKDQLVVRLPDEVPRDEPAVRLVLDTHLEGMALLACPAADELLDAMVRIWLGIGKALAETGTQVTLVTAAPKGELVQPVEQKLAPRLTKRVLELGARVAWQPVVPLGDLVKGTMHTIVVSCRPHLPAFDVSWVIVPEPAWTSAVEWSLTKQPPWMKLPYPTGSPENRKVRRDAERDRMIAIWDDRWKFSGLVGTIDWRSCAGEYVALPKQGSRVSLEVIQ